MKIHNKKKVIAVDLDGTIIFTDVLYEQIINLIKTNPLYIFYLFFLIFKGKAKFKSYVAKKTKLNYKNLPYNIDLINWLKLQFKSKKKIILCTAANKKVAQKIAKFFYFFSMVISSDSKVNNTGVNKRKILTKKFGLKGYDYVGNDYDDLIVWEGANKSYLVNVDDNLKKLALKKVAVAKIFNKKKNFLLEFFKLIRIHQWIKNILIFVPIIAANETDNLSYLLKLLIAFFSMGLCASAIYILNDLFDLESDRQHHSKKYRSIASGQISIKIALILMLLLICFSFIFSFFLNDYFRLSLLSYFFMSTIYTFYLKKLFIFDCMLLSIFYTFRVVIGALVVGIEISNFLIFFSIFIFLSLAFMKRYAELKNYYIKNYQSIPGRSYKNNDKLLLLKFGIISGNISSFILVLYLINIKNTHLYSSPDLLWLIIPLMFFWINWVWYKSAKGEMNDDPILFAIKDRKSLMTGLFIAIFYFMAQIL